MPAQNTVKNIIQQAQQSWDLGDVQHAEKLFIEATKKSKSSAEAWTNLAYFLVQEKKYAAALPALEKAFSIKKIPELFYHYGLACYHTDQLEEALVWFQRALAIPRTQNAAWNGYCNAFTYSNPYEKWQELNDVQPARPPLADWAYGVGIVKQALGAFILSDQTTFEKHHKTLAELEKSISNVNVSGMSQREITSLYKNCKHLLVYLTYFNDLAKTANWAPPTTDRQKLVIIGDSHSLALHNQPLSLGKQGFYGETNLVVGIKAWHLAQSTANPIRTGFLNRLVEIPDDATLLNICGEIDCRIDEGLILASVQQRKPLDKLITATAQGYIRFLKEHQARRRIIVGGVAAPTERALQEVPPQGRQTFKLLFREFNRALKTSALQAGFDFADIYSATVNKQTGLTKPDLHLDHRHTKPTTWALALDEFLHTP